MVPRATTREPRWPKERDLGRYNVLLGFDIQSFLTRGLWIEIGIGKGAKPMRPFIGLPGIQLRAIAPHRRLLPKGIDFTSGYVPEHAEFLQANRGRARLVTDIFGAVSYCDDPVQALVYGALLLRPDGCFVTFTELRRLGDLNTWDRISEFFYNRLHQEISFQTVYAWGDASARFSTYLRIQVRGKSSRRAGLREMLKEARRLIGTPTRDVAPLWASSDRSARIFGVRYASSGRAGGSAGGRSNS